MSQDTTKWALLAGVAGVTLGFIAAFADTTAFVQAVRPLFGGSSDTSLSSSGASGQTPSSGAQIANGKASSPVSSPVAPSRNNAIAEPRPEGFSGPDSMSAGLSGVSVIPQPGGHGPDGVTVEGLNGVRVGKN